jgi:hypothetical protein
VKKKRLSFEFSLKLNTSKLLKASKLRILRIWLQLHESIPELEFRPFKELFQFILVPKTKKKYSGCAMLFTFLAIALPPVQTVHRR